MKQLHALDQAWPGFKRQLEQFDEAWQSGRQPRIEEFWPGTHSAGQGTSDALSRRFLEELVRIDLGYRWRLPSPGPAAKRPEAEQPLLEHYVQRFPGLGPVQRLSVDLIGEEYWVRQRWGDRPSHAEYSRRFPEHSPNLSAALHRIDAELSSEFAPDPAPVVGAEQAGTVPSPSAAPCVPIASAGALVSVLRQSGLLSAAQADEVSQRLAVRFPELRALARELVERSWLTPYQVNQLLQGRGTDLILGPYVLLERLGEGGAGQVFKARHQKMNRIVALKVIRKELLADAEVVGRFYREIEVLSQLDHPNVVHAYDAGPAGKSHFLAMEFIEGTDLGKLVKQGGPMPVIQACEYIRQAALGLQHAHERGLVHRDIKPHNLIMGVRDGLIKVADLGLARLPRAVNQDMTSVLTGGVLTTGTLTPENAALIGTLDYLAPEQALSFHSADIRSDIYSLGCTLYYLLTSQSPVAGGTLAEKLLRHQQAEPPPVTQFRRDVPVGLTGVLGKMLAKRPEDRYQTPAEVAAALAPVLNSAGLDSGFAVATPSRPAGTPKISHLPSASAQRFQPAGPKRRRLLVAAIGGALLLALLGLTLLLVGGRGKAPSGVVSNTASLTVNAATGTSTPLTTGYTLGTLRRDFDGWLGGQIKVGSSNITVTQLGRFMVAGNSGTHTVKLVDAATRLDVSGSSVRVSMAGGMPGQFQYATLNSPVTVLANHSYYLVSQETSGGDQWYANNTTASTTSAASVISGVYGFDGSWWTIAEPGHEYGPVDLKYRK